MECAVERESESGRRGRPSAQATHRRMAHLLQVARRIFVERGYHATTMDDVAVAAGMTKRTLYAWHTDKAALFRACVLLGPEAFPTLVPDSSDDLRENLQRYAADLLKQLTEEGSFAMSVLFLRERAAFPELAGPVYRNYFDYVIEPLAVYMRGRGLEKAGANDIALLFLGMALAPLQNAMLVGSALPSAAEIEVHSRRCVAVFLAGAQAV